MKAIIYILLYIGLGMFYFFLLSSIGVVFGATYKECYSDPNWFVAYLIFMHWWLVILSLDEYYNKYLKIIGKPEKLNS